MRRLTVCAIGLVLGAALTACGDGKGTVNGTITFDAQRNTVSSHAASEAC